MKISIIIECETISELYTHISVIGKEIKRETKKKKLNPFTDEFPFGTELHDDNCYGEHFLNVESDSKS